MKVGKNSRPLVGMGVMVIKDGKVLIGRRKGSHAEGQWGFPGGHLELNESFEECAKREVFEETGVKIKNVRFQFLGNVKKYGKHYVQVGIIADWKSGEPKELEPKKLTDVKWIPVNEKAMPKPIFEMARLGLIAYKTGKNFFDS